MEVGGNGGGSDASQMAVSGQLLGHRGGGIDLRFVRVADDSFRAAGTLPAGPDGWTKGLLSPALPTNVLRKAYSGGMAEDNQGFSLPFKAPFSVVAAVFALTLIVWVFFDLMEMPLHAQGTTVVAAVMFALVSLVKWIWQRSQRRGGGK